MKSLFEPGWDQPNDLGLHQTSRTTELGRKGLDNNDVQVCNSFLGYNISDHKSQEDGNKEGWGKIAKHLNAA